MATTQLQITGMTCSACAARIEKSLSRMEGVTEVSVNLATARATIQGQERAVDPQLLIQKIKQLGYGAANEEQGAKPVFSEESKQLRNRFAVAFALSVPLLWIMLAHLFGWSEAYMPSWLMNPYLQLACATVLQFYVGYPFYYGAYQALKQRAANMDTLIAISTSSAYVYSHYLIFHPQAADTHHPYYFDSIAMILTAILLGKWLESVAKGKALHSLQALHNLQVEEVRILHPDGRESWIPLLALEPGMRTKLVAGDVIPLDGIVLEGTAEIDESLLTGESQLRIVRPGDRVYAGTRNLLGNMIVQSTTSASGSRLSRIIATVEDAQASKPAIQRSVDRIAAYFVPIMIVVAAITFVLWADRTSSGEALQHAMSVLLVACPCALGLATPVSILIGSSLMAESGIVLKEGAMIETLTRIDMFLLDKTGTLTEGMPAITSIEAVQGTELRLLRLAACLEQYSEHPIAGAIMKEAGRRRLLWNTAANVRELPGKGICGQVDGLLIHLGSYAWLKELGLVTAKDMQAGHSAQGATVLHLSIGQQWAGTITLRDRIRPDSLAAVRSLQQVGEVWLVTGDGEEAAKDAGGRTGIKRVLSGMLPEQKLEWVRKLQTQGHRVAMVGDGMNDSAALAASDSGFAMAGGNEAAMEAGDIVILNGRLTAVSEAVQIARQTYRNIRQNLVFALCYNVLTVPLAATGHLDPRIACLFMAFSSVIVVVNALRLAGIRSGVQRHAKEIKS